jgi:drug/metabolite transporter (DMT)-like permease
MLGALIPVVLVLLFVEVAGNSSLQIPTFSDLGWLLLLAAGCTAYPFVATVKLLRFFTAFNVALAVNFEPIYSIILAYFIFGESEQMTPVFYIGLCIVFGIVLFKMLTARKAPVIIEIET